ncbi:MAG: hypothetical protein GF364_15890 [Candidatus Lokiarchaeota archaeon]|nr:hypothetical protein [Candidatus Lokiarchaeota archaeon]
MVNFYFWSELLKLKFLEKSLTDLAEYGFGINLAVRPDLFNRVGTIVKQCNDLDVDLVFWPLLSYNNGYWVNAWNLSLQKRWIQKLMEQYPSVHTYTLDLEAPLNFKGIKGKIKTRKLAEIKHWRKVRQEMNELIDNMHNSGKKIISTNYPTNPSGRRAQGTPRPTNADYYSYMVYTSLFGIFGNDISKDNIVAYTGQKILNTHGPKQGIIDLGLTSGGVLPKFLPVTTKERVVSEVSICKYLGFKRIHIFALDEIRKDIRSWMEELKNTRPKAPPLDENPSKLGLLFRIFRTFLLNESFDIID